MISYPEPQPPCFFTVLVLKYKLRSMTRLEVQKNKDGLFLQEHNNIEPHYCISDKFMNKILSNNRVVLCIEILSYSSPLCLTRGKGAELPYYNTK